jgi:hypothetical protein
MHRFFGSVQCEKMNINLAPALLQNAGRKGFVTGHDFSRAESATENGLGFSPCCICLATCALAAAKAETSIGVAIGTTEVVPCYKTRFPAYSISKIYLSEQD